MLPMERTVLQNKGLHIRTKEQQHRNENQYSTGTYLSELREESEEKGRGRKRKGVDC